MKNSQCCLYAGVWRGSPDLGRETESYQRVVRRVDRRAETLGLPRRDLLWQCWYQSVAASRDLSLSEHQVNKSLPLWVMFIVNAVINSCPSHIFASHCKIWSYLFHFLLYCVSRLEVYKNRCLCFSTQKLYATYVFNSVQSNSKRFLCTSVHFNVGTCCSPTDI